MSSMAIERDATFALRALTGLDVDFFTNLGTDRVIDHGELFRVYFEVRGKCYEYTGRLSEFDVEAVASKIIQVRDKQCKNPK